MRVTRARARHGKENTRKLPSGLRIYNISPINSDPKADSNAKNGPSTSKSVGRKRQAVKRYNKDDSSPSVTEEITEHLNCSMNLHGESFIKRGLSGKRSRGRPRKVTQDTSNPYGASNSRHSKGIPLIKSIEERSRKQSLRNSSGKVPVMIENENDQYNLWMDMKSSFPQFKEFLNESH